MTRDDAVAIPDPLFPIIVVQGISSSQLTSVSNPRSSLCSTFFLDKNFRRERGKGKRKSLFLLTHRLGLATFMCDACPALLWSESEIIVLGAMCDMRNVGVVPEVRSQRPETCGLRLETIMSSLCFSLIEKIFSGH